MPPRPATIPRRRRVAALAFGLSVAIAGGPLALGCQAAPPSTPIASVSLPPELDRVLRDYERAWSGRDPAALAALFTDDGFTMSNGRPARRGHAAIREGYANAGGPLALRAMSYSVSDTVGFIIGAYATRTGDADIGKFVLALRRTRGGPWRIAADIDNGNGARPSGGN